MKLSRKYEIEFYEDKWGTAPVYKWIKEELSPLQRRALGTAMQEILQEQGINVCGSGAGEQLGDQVFEFRIRQDVENLLKEKLKDEESAQGEHLFVRVFCHAYGNKIILLLGGYDKGKDPSNRRQNREIQIAKARLRDFQNREAEKKKGK